MHLELLLIPVIAVLGIGIFGRFEEKTPRRKRLLKWLLYSSVAVALSFTAGAAWALAWIVALPAAGTTFHVWWCRKHGIGVLTAEPRDKYYALRGWS